MDKEIMIAVIGLIGVLIGSGITIFYQFCFEKTKLRNSFISEILKELNDKIITCLDFCDSVYMSLDKHIFDENKTGKPFTKEQIERKVYNEIKHRLGELWGFTEKIEKISVYIDNYKRASPRFIKTKLNTMYMAHDYLSCSTASQNMDSVDVPSLRETFGNIQQGLYHIQSKILKKSIKLKCKL